MDMSCSHQPMGCRRALAAATGLVASASLPLAGASRSAAASGSFRGPALASAAAYTNPVIWQDFADIDVIRVEGTYYASASTMHYSPGAPVLRSYDLVNWEIAGHSVPVLDFGAKYDLNGGRGYVRGIWASSLAYRPSNKTFYWLGQIDFSRTYLYTAAAVEGPWNRLTTISTPYYDAGLLVDSDDTLYVAYGNTTISVAQLSPDGRTQVRTQQVFSTPSSVGTLEGSRFYKINGQYYIFLTRPANGQDVLKSSSGPFGPYTLRAPEPPAGLRHLPVHRLHQRARSTDQRPPAADRPEGGGRQPGRVDTLGQDGHGKRHETPNLIAQESSSTSASVPSSSRTRRYFSYVPGDLTVNARGLPVPGEGLVGAPVQRPPGRAVGGALERPAGRRLRPVRRRRQRVLDRLGTLGDRQIHRRRRRVRRRRVVEQGTLALQHVRAGRRHLVAPGDRHGCGVLPRCPRTTAAGPCRTPGHRPWRPPSAAGRSWTRPGR
ncbi:hypothetical protein SPURM210S_06948 [Streptomyces purpurascens]